MNVNYDLSIDQKHFIQEEHQKHRLVLHHSGGLSASETVQRWKASKKPIGVPYIIDERGTIYEIAPHEYYAAHLGLSDEMERTSLGIELVNAGPLILEDGMLKKLDGKNYCHMDEHQLFTVHARPWRGRSFFANFTRPQYAALNQLIGHLKAHHDIPANVLPEHQRLELIAKPERFYGTAMHCNFSASAMDAGPALDWQWIS